MVINAPNACPGPRDLHSPIVALGRSSIHRRQFRLFHIRCDGSQQMQGERTTRRQVIRCRSTVGSMRIKGEMQHEVTEGESYEEQLVGYDCSCRSGSRHNRGVRAGHARWRLVGRRLRRPSRKNGPGWLGRWPGTGPTRPIDSVPATGAWNHRPIPAPGSGRPEGIPAAAGSTGARDHRPIPAARSGRPESIPAAAESAGARDHRTTPATGTRYTRTRPAAASGYAAR
jgi:hypothetical protein